MKVLYQLEHIKEAIIGKQIVSSFFPTTTHCRPIFLCFFFHSFFFFPLEVFFFYLAAISWSLFWSLSPTKKKRLHQYGINQRPALDKTLTKNAFKEKKKLDVIPLSSQYFELQTRNLVLFWNGLSVGPLNSHFCPWSIPLLVFLISSSHQLKRDTYFDILKKNHRVIKRTQVRQESYKIASICSYRRTSPLLVFFHLLMLGMFARDSRIPLHSFFFR